MFLKSLIGGCVLSLPFVAIAATEVCTKMTATGNSEYPPYLWRADANTDELLGANRRIFDELSRRLQIPIELKHTGPWSRAQSEVRNGYIDLMAGAFYTNERVEYMDYIAPAFLYTSSVIWQNKLRPFEFVSKMDLIGKRGVTVINNSFGQTFDDFARDNLDVLAVASVAQAFKMLEVARVDYAIYEEAPGMAYTDLLSVSHLVEPVLPSISSESLFLTISKKSPCNTIEIKQKMATILKDMRAEGFTEQALSGGLQDWHDFAPSKSMSP
jgi:polar amino acid transport system substrate-binding protein